jgi:cytochrome c oxidase subunit 3
MTLALPSAPAPAPRRQLFVATALVVSGAAMLMAGMLGMWMRFRAGAPLRTSADGLEQIKDWLPAAIKVPEVAANTMVITFPFAALMTQWAVYATKRRDGQHRSLALLITIGLGIAIVNAQLAIYAQMGVGISDGAYQSMFYAITGTMLLLVIGGIVFSAVAFFRSVGGRNDDSHVISAHALYWYFLTVAFTAVWFFVYVQK